MCVSHLLPVGPPQGLVNAPFNCLQSFPHTIPILVAALSNKTSLYQILNYHVNIGQVLPAKPIGSHTFLVCCLYPETFRASILSHTY